MALASANASATAAVNDNNLPRFEACNPSLERTEQDVLAAKQLTSLRKGIILTKNLSNIVFFENFLYTRITVFYYILFL